ncbi:hypothetical protein TVAG_276140 [Trichomonas vaginalis G3]|uniref:Uncharacterized protein n=1 Tax=Trichomonas vaginalis (strain ATCC PRA-98 / G3) TaxID=412133 RepID=A2ECP5_TRIV3|nr:hypothetical protein TVAGG3_0379590 [Trichomonas vaginalis G3]EAY09541.1 hypothetical protein TVAG_276140 [Trichomonas vaginalis G3]KAI5533168.1 hypothetical protein TVAGG3_0379590 [Trichomonas vaginalis G3]|eukprot:XP_001321764.1 hypothetical protein [Trichomonas vaginalis G3]
MLPNDSYNDRGGYGCDRTSYGGSFEPKIQIKSNSNQKKNPKSLNESEEVEGPTFDELDQARDLIVKQNTKYETTRTEILPGDDWN